MDNEVKQSADFYQLVAWLHANRTRVIAILAAVLVVGGVIGGYVWYKNAHETAAADALSNVKPPASAQEAASPPAADAQPYLKVADDYPGTQSGGRALIIAGGILFDAGKFDEARGTFERFMRDYSDSPFSAQALLGVAASLEAAGKNAEALTHYEDLVKHHPADAITPQSKSGLARLYVERNQPEQAMHLYEEMAKINNNDSWSAEASIQLEELLVKYPNLRKPVTPVVNPTPTPTPTLTLPPSK